MTWDQIIRVSALIGLGFPIAAMLISTIRCVNRVVGFFTRLEATLDKVVETHSKFTEKLEEFLERP